MKPFIDHVQVTVRDLDASEPFYDLFLSLVGYDVDRKVRASIDSHDFEVIEYGHPQPAFAITSPRPSVAGDEVHRRRPGSLHHLAFRVSSREDVDRIYAALVAGGADIVTPPRDYPEYVPQGYYALFCKDPDGLKYEVVTADPYRE